MDGNFDPDCSSRLTNRISLILDRGRTEFPYAVATLDSTQMKNEPAQSLDKHY